MDGGCKCQVAKCTSPLFPSSRFLSLFLSSFRVICLTLSFSSFVRASPSSFHANCAPPVCLISTHWPSPCIGRSCSTKPRGKIKQLLDKFLYTRSETRCSMGERKFETVSFEQDQRSYTYGPNFPLTFFCSSRERAISDLTQEIGNLLSAIA